MRCLNSAKVSDFDTEGNAPATAQDQSYTGEPLGDCAVACPANAFKVLSVCAGQAEVEIHGVSVGGVVGVSLAEGV